MFNCFLASSDFCLLLTFDTLIVFLKEFFEKVNFEKKKVSMRQQKIEKLASMRRVKAQIITASFFTVQVN